MKTITLQQDKKKRSFFTITFDYDEKIIEAIKKIPQRKFEWEEKVWTVPADISIVHYIDVFGHYFQFDWSAEALDALEKLKNPENPEIPPLKMELREFQKKGVAYAIKAERCFIADDMGTGKTAESIIAVETVNAYPCLVVCPASVKLNWQKEINMWVQRNSVIVSGEKPELMSYDADFVIINYDILQYHKNILKKKGFQSIIFDESHAVKGHKSIRTKVSKSIAKNIRYRMALTGTPVLNKPRELISQLDIIGRLDSFGGFWAFAKRYCDAKESVFGWDFSGHSNMMELHEKLQNTCYIRRMKKDVLDELPDKQRTLVPVELDNMDEYKQVKNDFIKWVRNTLIDPKQYAKELSKVKKLTKHQKELLIQAKINLKISRTRAAEAMVKMEYLKQVCARGKLKRFTEFIDNVLEQDNKLVVFAIHRDIQQKLYDSYKSQNIASIYGDQDLADRQANVDKFQNDPGCKLMLCSLATGGIGITLTAASIVAFIELGWTPALHDQAEDRLYRMGQKNSVNCYYFYCKDTIDDYILEMLDEKRKITQAVVDGIDVEPDGSDIEKILKKFV